MHKRVIDTLLIKNAIIDLVYSANFYLSNDVKYKFRELKDSETCEIAGMTLGVLLENSEIAEAKKLPLCQDCGVAIVFIDIGQEVILIGEDLNRAINDGIEEAYDRFYLRKSVVMDPLRRISSGKNTPCFIHADIIPGDRIKIMLYLKGGGSENMTVLKMFRPTVPIDEIIDFIVDSVSNAGSNPCPPIFLGVGIGGTADAALLNSKKAVLRGDSRHPDPYYAELENKIFERINMTNIGPLGFGGKSTAAGVYIKTAPTHIASLPVALNMNCHSLRYKGVEI
jgi:fumarate hydratase subunit alpha